MRVFRAFRRVVCAAAMAAALSSAAYGQLGRLGLGKDKDKEKADKTKQAASALDDRSTEEFYLEMRSFAEGLYNQPVGEGDKKRDSDFKKQVDSEYENLRRIHAKKAFETNLSAKSEIRYIIEDRYREFSGLYDNLLVQDLLNRTGQSIVPQSASRLYTFKLLADPIPSAETLSTGTIYVSTGLIALLNTKAELAYVLAHEAAHVYREHHKIEIMVSAAADQYAERMQENRESVRRKVALAGAVIGGIVGAKTGNTVGAATLGATLGGIGGYTVASLLQGADPRITEWNSVQEEEADQIAFQWMLESRQNIENIPKVYLALQDAGDRDDRAKLGFLGRTNRIRERLAKVESLIQAEKAKPDYASRTWQVSDADFDILMAEVKRDNGILAYHHDMLEMARSNLEQAVAVKTTDPTALYYYAKIVKATGRTEEERAKSLEYFRRAAENDQRNLNFGANLHRAVALLRPDATKAEKDQSIDLMKQYLEGYYLSKIEAQQRQTVYPPHLETIYDYMSRLGEFKYTLRGDKVLREAAARMADAGPTVERAAPAPAQPPRPAEAEAPPPAPAKPKPATTKPASNKVVK